jgi:general secretion pathway protein D
VNGMRVAVESIEPDQALKTAIEAAPEHRVRGCGATPQRGIETGVRGHLEQVALMQLQRLDRRNRVFHVGKNIFRMGVAPLLACGFMGITTVAAHAQSASSWDKKGQNAEAREDFDAAFEAFRQAHFKKPKDLRYRERYERTRFEAANLHVDRGRVLRQSGDIGGAVNEFARALQIDPGNQAAAQELQVTEKPAQGSAAAGPPIAGGGANPGQVIVPRLSEQTPYQAEVQKDIASMGSPVTLIPVSDDPITLHSVEDAKFVYKAVCKAAGLNVIFDPDYAPKRITIDLNSVSLADALHIVGIESGTFWKPVTSNTIFVAQNTREKRTNLDDLAVQTFYLTNVSQQNDANEILIAIRNLLNPGL